ncbi:unnamed protein product, partial [Polarella glacialis]
QCGATALLRASPGASASPRSASFASSAKLSLPALGLKGRYFTKTHEWFQVEDDGIGVVGITQVAQRALGEVVYCRLPREGERFKVMDTIATLEALKAVGEVKCPVQGEVLEINPRLLREPALITHAPLTDGWLVRIAFSGHVPRYLLRSGAIVRSEIEPLLADLPSLTSFLRDRLGGPDSSEDAEALEELTFDGLRAIERLSIHNACEELGLFTASYGSGPGRQLVVRRRPPEGSEEQEPAEQDVSAAGASRDKVGSKSRGGRRSPGRERQGSSTSYGEEEGYEEVEGRYR